MNYRRLRDFVITACFVLLVALIAVKLETGEDRRFEGVFRAVDGDSLTSAGHRLRLRGIDAPELKQTCKRAGVEWGCGLEARNVLARLAQKPGVICRGAESDKYGRLLVTCHDKATDINGAMVRAGLAVAFGGHEMDEQFARTGRLGIWAGEFVRPSDWRRAHSDRSRDERQHNSSFFQRWFGIE